MVLCATASEALGGGLKLRFGKSPIYNPNVQECDATEASFMYLSPVHKILKQIKKAFIMKAFFIEQLKIFHHFLGKHCGAIRANNLNDINA